MKEAAQTLVDAIPAEKSWAAVYADLIKARLTFLVLLTTLVGFYLGWRGPMDYLRMLHTVLGTGLVASGAAALNQLLERDYDAKMRRTRNRPLPSGRLQPTTVMIFGGVCGCAGLLYLALAVNLTTSVIGAVSLLSYLFIYTPLKRITWLNTVVGAVPGGLPPLMGWTAARGELNTEGWALFAILAFWQLPHFFAIAWMYRDEYSKAGFRMISNDDSSGERSASQSVFFCILLLVIAGLPTFLGITTLVYLAIELALGGLFIAVAMRFLKKRTVAAARLLLDRKSVV